LNIGNTQNNKEYEEGPNMSIISLMQIDDVLMYLEADTSQHR